MRSSKRPIKQQRKRGRYADDVIDGQPITVWWGAADTADSLDAATVADGAALGTGVACVPVIDGRVLTFSAVGDVLFTDAETGSMWNILGRAVDGPLAGRELELAVHQNEFWFAWTAFNPDAAVHGSE